MRGHDTLRAETFVLGDPTEVLTVSKPAEWGAEMDGGGGGSACMEIAFSVEAPPDMGGTGAEWTFDAAYMDDLSSTLAANEAYIDASIHLDVYYDPTLTECVTGIAVAVVEGGAWGAGSSPGTRTIPIRKVPPLRKIRVRKV